MSWQIFISWQAVSSSSLYTIQLLMGIRYLPMSLFRGHWKFNDRIFAEHCNYITNKTGLQFLWFFFFFFFFYFWPRSLIWVKVWYLILSFIVQSTFVFWTCQLTHCSWETPKRVSGKQCRPRSDAAECGIWSGSSLFANTSAIFLLEYLNLIASPT